MNKQPITQSHIRILEIFGTCSLANRFYLAGGTALAAVYLQHRISQDLDIFTGEKGIIKPTAQEFKHKLIQNDLDVEIELNTPSFVRFLAGHEKIKIELAQDSPYRIKKPTKKLHGIWVSSLEDLAGDKVLTLFGRFASRDFVDVYFLAEKMGKDTLINLASKKDPGFDLYWFVKSLGAIDNFNPIEVEMLVPVDYDMMKEFYRNWACECLQKIADNTKNH